MLVLFGLPGQAQVDARSLSVDQLPAWWRDSGSAACGAVGVALVGINAPCAAAFAADRALFSFAHGSNALVSTARARLQAAGETGAAIAAAVQGMCSLHGDERPALDAVLSSPAFADFRIAAPTPGGEAAQSSIESLPGDVELEFDP